MFKKIPYSVPIYKWDGERYSHLRNYMVSATSKIFARSAALKQARADHPGEKLITGKPSKR